MKAQHRALVASFFSFALASCGGNIRLGDLGGSDASIDEGSTSGMGGTGGSGGATTGTGGSGDTAGTGGATTGSGGVGGTGTGGGTTTGSGGAGGSGGTTDSGGTGGATTTGSGGTGTGGTPTGSGGATTGTGGGGAGGGASGAGGDDGGRPASCASGIYWTGGNAASALMSPGRPCMGAGCHTSTSKTPMTVAGTVYSPMAFHDDDDCNGVDSTTVGAAVSVLDDSDGSQRMELIPRLQVNAAGNFFTTRALPASFRVKVIMQGREIEMKGPVTDGNCNACHTRDGFAGAMGRITGASP